MFPTRIAWWSLLICGGSLVQVAIAGGPPTQQAVVYLPSGEWFLSKQVQKPIYETVLNTVTAYEQKTVNKEVTKTVVVNGEEQTVTETVQETIQIPVTKQVPTTVCKTVSILDCGPAFEPQEATAFETDGRPIAAADLMRRCPNGTLVVVSADEEMIPDYYAAVFNPGTIILALPPSLRSYPTAPPVEFAPQPVAPGAPIPQPRPSAARDQLPLRLVSQSAAPEGTTPQSAQPPLPNTPAPELVFLSREGVDSVKIRQYEESTVEAEITVKANDSSISPEEKQKVIQISRRSASTTVPWSALRFGRLQQGRLPIDQVKERLGQGEVTAVMSADGAIVDPFWLQNIKPSVLVVRGVKLPMSASAPPPPPQFPIEAPQAPAPPVPVDAPQPPRPQA